MDLALAFDNAQMRGDLAWADADLATDAGLRSAVIISLFTDAPAEAAEPLPDPTDTDRRGWWGNAFALEGETAGPLGSKLWLRVRAFATEATRRQIEADCADALVWMVRQGVVAAVDVGSTWLAPGQLLVTIALRRTAGQAAAERIFDFAWRAEGVL